MKIRAIPDVRKDIVVEILIISPFKLATWLLPKLDGSWRMTGDPEACGSSLRGRDWQSILFARAD